MIRMLIPLGLLLCFALHSSVVSSRLLLQHEVTVDSFCANLNAIENDLTDKVQTDSPDELILSGFNCSCSAETEPVLSLNCTILFRPAENDSVQVELTHAASFKSNTFYVLETVTTCTTFAQQERGCFTYELGDDCDNDSDLHDHFCARSCRSNLCGSCEICDVSPATTTIASIALQKCGDFAFLDTTCENAVNPVLLWSKDSFPIITLVSDDNMTTTSGVITVAGNYLGVAATVPLFVFVVV